MYAPAGRFHRTAFAGDGMSGRISIHGIASSLNLLDPENSAAAAQLFSPLRARLWNSRVARTPLARK